MDHKYIIVSVGIPFINSQLELQRININRSVVNYYITHIINHFQLSNLLKKKGLNVNESSSLLNVNTFWVLYSSLTVN